MRACHKVLRGMQWMAFAGLLCASSPLGAAPSVQEVVKTYADIALAGYEDALASAKTLKAAIDRLVAKPTDGRRSRRRGAPGRRRACPTCRRRPIASATRSSTTGKAGSTPGRSTRA